MSLIYKFIFRCCLLIPLVGCAPSGPPIPAPSSDVQKQKASFVQFETKLKQSAQRSRGRELLGYLTEESKLWLEDMLYASTTLYFDELETKEFHEQLTILGIRHAYMSQKLKVLDAPHVLQLLARQGPLKKALFMKGQTEPWFENANAFKGLDKAPQVPVYFYKQEFNYETQAYEWRLDLVRMFPIITRGIQTLAHKKKMAYPRAIRYLLEKATGQNFGERLFEPLEG